MPSETGLAGAGGAGSGGGGGGGEVTQGEGSVADPWYMQGVSGGVAERLATATLQGAGLPAVFTGGGGVKVGIVDAIPAGANTIGKTDQGAGTGTAAGYYTVRLSDGSNFIPLPTALISSRFPTDISADVRNPAAVGWTLPTTPIPTVGAIVYIRSSGSGYPLSGASDGSLYVQGVYGVGNSNTGNPFPCGFKTPAGNNIVPLTDTTGRIRVGIMGEAPLSADATTDVWIRVPAGNGRTAATSGVGAILASAGRLRSARVSMTNANNVWIAFHNAATATTATEANMLAGPWNVSGIGAYVNYEPPIAEACTAGCKVVAWTDATMTTIDTTATFTFYARAM